MIITITAASSKCGRATISALKRNQNVTIRGIYRDISKADPDIEAVQGDYDSLDYSGSDAILAFVPPIVNGDDRDEIFARVEANCVKMRDAAERARVKRIVLLSSIGGEVGEGTGELISNHISERVFRQSTIPLTIGRFAYFMENWEPIGDKLYSVMPMDYKIPMIAVTDIGEMLASSLVGEGPTLYAGWGPEEYCPADVQRAFGLEMEYVPREGLHGFFLQVFPNAIAHLYEEMTKAFLPGGPVALDSGSLESIDILRGRVSIEENVKRRSPG